MLDIIALFFLCKYMSKLATRKGERPRKWIWNTILGWFLAEFAGLFLGLIFFGKDNLVGLLMLGVISAIGGYLIVHAKLQKLPDIAKNN
jgi:hypothetical protein